MAMSDCRKCWETPCCCGYYHKYHHTYGTTEGTENYITGILDYRTKEELETILQLLNEKILNKITTLNAQDEPKTIK